MRKIPEEILEMISKSNALEELRDLYVKLPWGYNKARKAAIEAQATYNGAARKLAELYPEITEGKWGYSRSKGTIERVGDETIK